MDTSALGKVLRVSLLATLVSTLVFSIALIGTYTAVSIIETVSVDMPLIYRIICFLPICALSIICIVFVSLQTKRILALEEIVIKADNIPNDYRFTPPNTTKSKKPRVVKILIIVALALVFIFAVLGSQGAILRIVLEIVLNPEVPQSEKTFFALNITILVLYALLYIAIALSASLGGACIFIGGRSAHVDELERVLVQKSNYAELRVREENDDLDELSQIF